MKTAIPVPPAAALDPLVGDEHVLTGSYGQYLSDASSQLPPRAIDAVVRPGSAREVCNVLRWAYEHDVPVTARGGGTGLAGGAVPLAGGIVLSLERLTAVRSLEPGSWSMEVEAGLTTAHVQRLARESGLFFPCNPGAAEQSQIGGNLATNAGGPRAFKYGPVRASVTGIEAVVPPGEIVRFGGAARKDVAGYDLAGLLIGSEGTLGVITSAWLRLLPAPESRAVLSAFYPSLERLVEALMAVLASGAVPSAIEYLDSGALEAVAPTFPGDVPHDAASALLVELDGWEEEVAAAGLAVADALSEGALAPVLRVEGDGAEAQLAWRDSVSWAVKAKRGGKLSEDICVPLGRLPEAIVGTVEIGERHGLEACSWGHAGDGNIHSTFMLSAPESPEERQRAAACADELFELAIGLGGTISGEHGVGLLKNGRLRDQWTTRATALHRRVKSAFDPKNLMNPGKKLP
jgi:glycolate oxidase subunit GlcD